MAVTLVVAALTLTTGSGDPDWLAEWSERAAYGLTVELVDEYREQTWEPPEAVPLAGGVDGWESLIQIYFEPEDWEWARDVIRCESLGNPDAYNASSGASGLWQFLASTWEFSKPWPDASPFDPTAAFMAARWLRDNLGRSQWSCTSIMGY